MCLIVTLISIYSCHRKAESPAINTPAQTETDNRCEALPLCAEYEESFKACSLDNKSNRCDKFIELFEKLAQKKDCSYKNDLTLGAIPAIWKCDEGREYPKQIFIHSCILLNKLATTKQQAQDLFISDLFRSVLSGESAEAFQDKSLAFEKYYSGKKLTSEETFTLDNIQKLEKSVKEQLVQESDWRLLISYLTTEIPQSEIFDLNAIPNYSSIAQVIVNKNDPILTKFYLNFILATKNSADEMRSYGLANIYNSMPHEFLDILSAYNPNDIEILIKS